MKYITLHNSDQIPVLGLGTWAIGGSFSPDYSQDDEALAAIQTAIDLGYTHIDTAEMYSGGHTEELIGRTVKNYNRSELFITTKVNPSNLAYHDLLDALSGSLERLEIDYVDLYLIHRPNASIPMEETFKALNELVARSQVKHLGVSNFSLAELKQAQALSNTPIVTNQVPYSLFNRQYVDNGVLEYCQAKDILLTAYSPIKSGVLGNHIVRQIAEKYNATPAQVALHWLIRQPNVITIPKSSNMKHLKENLGALNIELSVEDVEQLSQLV